MSALREAAQAVVDAWGSVDPQEWLYTAEVRMDALRAALAAPREAAPRCGICPHPPHVGWCSERSHGDPCSCRVYPRDAAPLDVDRLERALQAIGCHQAAYVVEHHAAAIAAAYAEDAS